eukprot:8094036-Pyramimonas_sp.AAC.2
MRREGRCAKHSAPRSRAYCSTALKDSSLGKSSYNTASVCRTRTMSPSHSRICVSHNDITTHSDDITPRTVPPPSAVRAPCRPPTAGSEYHIMT